MGVQFPFPFEPYEIQRKFMRELYFTIEKNNLGIFESPTGTGKSLSICCGALQWQKDSYKKCLESLQTEISELKQKMSSIETTDNWLEEKFEEITIKRSLIALELKLANHKKRIDSFNEMKQRVKKKEKHDVKKAIDYKNKNTDDLEIDNKENEADKDVDLILEECEKDSESEDEVETEENENNDSKIYISSRTHSQLSQFIGEIKRTVFREDTRVVTLASRQHYCINSEVAKLKNVNLINERCLDMQKSKNKSTSVDEDGKVLKKTKTKSCTSCPYYNHSNIARLKETMLVEMMDIEDLVKCGKTLKACPYYASRMALEDAEVVLVSHAGMVSAGARSGFSLKLHNNVLILDEAHGLTTALESAHSAPVSTKQLTAVKTFLKFYIDKYRARLSSKNLLTLNQMNFVVGKLVGMIKPKSTAEKQEDTTIMTLEDFVIKAEIDHMNLRPLVEFCRKTRLAPKLHGFSMRYSQQALEEENKRTVEKKSSFKDFLSNISKKKTEVEETVKEEVKPAIQAPTETSAGSGLYAILDFLDRLCDRSVNGRILVQSGESGLLKYLLLNPADHFSDVVKQCRSVILAGGTMEPISEFKDLLKSDGKEVNVVKCGHVVPPDNVLGVCLSKGPSNVSLNFSYENRMSKELLKEVSSILRNVCSIVPGGVVCFLPSYSYEKTVYEHLHANKVIENICKKKSVFREPKSSAEVDQVLNKFAAAVKSKEGNRNGALMLSVVGGKLSEGLNFSDDLGRCIIVVGMPYPNVKSPELQEKMNYLNRTNGSGSAYYENLCMKAVNQCIGRAVRHANDYACVLLVDDRYSRPHTMAALPSFVQKSLMSNCNFGPTVGSMAKFFAKHKNSS
ncbi:ATP-dependent DNA helicase DDX11-like [Leguminivora glycinivorella]|uniref:ATP-dependent DNA helicase DDX11-like n=1 Tax=Leguminivora glycinivorella TaxID=1035111 RepID=UPI00200BD86B|nr:ATP-dependent DNA helicase DDX11-like [Leguminivora glycinivorella]